MGAGVDFMGVRAGCDVCRRGGADTVWGTVHGTEGDGMGLNRSAEASRDPKPVRRLSQIPRAGEAGLRPADSRGRLFPHELVGLCGCDAAEQVFLFGLVFGADGEGVEDAERESVLDGFILALG